MTKPPDTSTVLIIDDTPSNLAVAVKLMEDRGYQVAIAQDGEEGVKRADLLLPDLILLDVMLPGADGFEICHRLKAQQNTRDIPVIFMTALVTPESKLKGFQAGGVDYVTKPLQIDEVIARVGTHLRLGAAQRQLVAQNLRLEKHGAELERRVAERTQALTDSECHFRTLAENLPDCIVRYDRMCRVTYFNPAVGMNLAPEFQPVRGMAPDESHPGVEPVRAFRHLLEQVMVTGDSGEIELDLRDRGGAQRTHHLRLVAERDTRGTVVGGLVIGRDVTERRRMAQRLEESQLLLRQLATRNEDAREEERRRLKREIHDELGQYLSALRLGISVVDIQLGKKHSQLHGNTQRLIDLVDATIKVVRDVVAALRPSALDMGIASALEWLAAEHFERTGNPCELHIPSHDLDMDDKRATAVFRIAQESLTNIARHAQAMHAAIFLEQSEGRYLLEVRDNGQGFDPSVRKDGSFGLIGIRERVLMLGGKVDISSIPGKTSIQVQFPAER